MLRSERGSVAIQLGLMMTVILGMVALGVEITFLLYKHRQMQSAADSSALGGATALMRGYPADFRVESRAIAANAGFVNGVDDVTVTVNQPPTLGPHAGESDAVEVIVSQPQYLGLASLFHEGLFQVGARAVAVKGHQALYCMLALDPTANQAIRVQNNASVPNPDCGVAVNSNSDTALYLRNNASVAGPVSVHGNWSLSNNANLTGSPLIDHAAVVDDPYADVTIQSVPPCDTAQRSSGGNNETIDLHPGHFCNGWTYQNNVTVNLAHGTYYIDDHLTLFNNAVLNATDGVTLVINGNYPINIGNNAIINLTAPSTGDYAGIAIMGLRDATPSVEQTFSNNTILNVTGAIYFPNQTIKMDNNGSTTSCTQVIGRAILVNNNVWLDNDCAGTGVIPINQTVSKLVE